MRKCWGCLIALILLFSICGNALAYDAEKHNEIFEGIMFGDQEFSQKATGQVQARVLALECASELCIDQYNLSGKQELAYLQGKPTEDYPQPLFTISGIPDSVSVINFNGNYAHRYHTHRGWNPNPLPTVGEWSIRKNILMQTVRKTLAFKSEKKADSFAAIVYYIHILGDHQHDTSYKASRYMMPIVRLHPSESNPDIIYELEYHFSILFDDQVSSSDYIQLHRLIESKAQEMRSMIRQNNEVFTDQEYAKFKGCTVDLINILSGKAGNKPYFHNLLNTVPEFSTAFGTNR